MMRPWSPKGLGWTIGKVSLTLVCIALIGIAVGSDGQVQETRADIVVLDQAERPKTEQFSRALTALGHPTPRVYELNGNRIFFSVHQAEGTPVQLLARYQDEFVRQGLNPQPFYGMDDAEYMQRKRVGFTGGVVPMSLDDQAVIMGGVERRDRRDHPLALVRALVPGQGPDELFDGYRWVEIEGLPGRARSTITATWSDEGFDYQKMFPESWSRPGKGVDPRIPICAGCQRVNQLGERARAGTHESYVFVTDSTRAELERFYRRRLAEQGWELSQNFSLYQQLIEEVALEGSEMKPMEFRRDDLLLDVQIFPFEDHKMAVRTVLVDHEYLEELTRR